MSAIFNNQKNINHRMIMSQSYKMFKNIMIQSQWLADVLNQKSEAEFEEFLQKYVYGYGNDTNNIYSDEEKMVAEILITLSS